MRRILLVSFLILACASTVLSAPPPEKVKELKGFLLDRADIPFSKQKGIYASKWVIMPTDRSGKPVVVDSLVQVIRRSAMRTEITVQSAVFGSREEALQAADSRVRELKAFQGLEDKSLNANQLTGQAAVDKVFGLYDPPETQAELAGNPRGSLISTTAVVLFVKKDVCVQVQASSIRSNVNIDYLERLAKKIAARIKPKEERAADLKAGK